MSRRLPLFVQALALALGVALGVALAVAAGALLVGCSYVDEAPGEQGPPGPPGPRGLRGEPGVALPPARYLVTNAAEGEAFALSRVFVFCEDGDAALSGGCSWGEAGGQVSPLASQPVGDPPVGWECSGLSVVDAPSIITASLFCEAAP